MSEHWLPSYSRLLEKLVQELAKRQLAEPLETIDRIDCGFYALKGLDKETLQALLTVAIDKLAVQL